MNILKLNVVGRGLLVVLALFSTIAHAELVATPLRGDTRLVQFPYDADNTYLVLAKPKAVTHLQFAEDEAIQSVAAGDTQSWELTPTKNRHHIFVKPKYENLETSVTVLTSKRTYQFVLKSTGDGRKWYQRVNWLYGTDLILEDESVEAAGQDPVTKQAPPSDDQGITVAGPGQQHGGQMHRAGAENPAGGLPVGLKPTDLKFGYEISGDAPFKPLVAFDNGKFTYLGMPPAMQEMPALFAVIDGSDFALVNYTIEGNYMVAQRLLDVAILKLGKQEVRVVRQSQKPSFFNWGTSR